METTLKRKRHVKMTHIRTLLAALLFLALPFLGHGAAAEEQAETAAATPVAVLKEPRLLTGLPEGVFTTLSKYLSPKRRSALARVCRATNMAVAEDRHHRLRMYLASGDQRPEALTLMPTQAVVFLPPETYPFYSFYILYIISTQTPAKGAPPKKLP